MAQNNRPNKRKSPGKPAGQIRGNNMSIAKRMMVVLIVIVSGFAAVTGRLFYIQIVKGKEYQEIAVGQQTRDISVAAKRGTIYDRNGKALAVSATAYKVVLSPVTLKDEDDRQKVLDALPAILGIDRAVIEKSLEKTTYYDIIARRVEKSVADDVRAFISENGLVSHISVGDDPKLFYPYIDFACHVLGFVGTDNQGLAGLEIMYDDYLKGADGRIIAAKDAVGNDLSLLEYEKYIPAQDGYNLVLTLDETIQHYLEKRLATAYTDHKLSGYAAGIIMDVKTGGVLAMAVKNGFDLNDPFTISDPNVLEYIDGLTGDERSSALVTARQEQWKNVLLTDQYEPGSTFKIFTSSMAVEEKVVSAGTTFYCPGYKMVGGWRIRCANNNGHGHEDFQTALNNSCNPAFMDIGELIGAEAFDKYMTGFGFRERTGIDLPGEGVGILHPLSNLGPTQLATSAFGQTFKITPMQLITAVSAVANGGTMMQPYLVSGITDNDGNVVESFEPTAVKQVISGSTAQTITQMLETVVSDGGGRNAYAKGFRVCGKSGTSQKIDQKNEDGSYEHTASFVAYAPADDPQVAILIILDEPQTTPIYGGTIAAPIVSNLMEEVLTYMDVSPQFTEQELDQQDVAVPNLIGMDSADARAALSRKNLGTKIIGGDGQVERQVPAAGSSIPYTGTVLLYTNGATPDQEIVVPSLLGRTAAGANTELVNLGRNIKIVGKDPYESGVAAVAQSHPAGTVGGAGTVITVEFRSQTTIED